MRDGGKEERYEVKRMKWKILVGNWSKIGDTLLNERFSLDKSMRRNGINFLFHAY